MTKVGASQDGHGGRRPWNVGRLGPYATIGEVVLLIVLLFSLLRIVLLALFTERFPSSIDTIRSNVAKRRSTL